MPSSICLILAAISPDLYSALGLLLFRSALSQMDVPTRSSYVMAVVTPPERPAAASVTAVPRNTAVSFKNDTLQLTERAKGANSIALLAKLPHIMFFRGGVVIKLGDEVIGSIGASGAPGANLDDGCVHAGLDKIRDQLK